MNLKLAKRIRQGMREMAHTKKGGAIRGDWPADYEGTIPRKRGRMFLDEFGGTHYFPGELWATKQTDQNGTETYIPSRLVVRLRKAAPRQVYKRAKRMVAAV